MLLEGDVDVKVVTILPSFTGAWAAEPLSYYHGPWISASSDGNLDNHEPSRVLILGPPFDVKV